LKGLTLKNPQNEAYMKTSNWIKLIGISCIVLGSTGVMNHISSLFIPQWVIDTWLEIDPDRLKLKERLVYIGIFVNIIYLIAGIYFLLKKPFSLVLMYAALIISLLYAVIPLLFLKSDDELIFVAIRPIIDLYLLILVWRINKHYYEEPDEEVYLFGKINLSPLQLKLLTFLGLLCLAIPLLLQGLWIYVRSLTATQAEGVALFQSYQPECLQGPYAVLYVSLALSLLAIIFSSMSLSLSEKLWKYLNAIILILASLMLLLSLFQLM
jgi:hypothetical protein